MDEKPRFPASTPTTESLNAERYGELSDQPFATDDDKTSEAGQREGIAGGMPGNKGDKVSLIASPDKISKIEEARRARTDLEKARSLYAIARKESEFARLLALAHLRSAQEYYDSLMDATVEDDQ